MFFLHNGKEVIEISKELRRLRNREPVHNEYSMIVRTNIMGYELAALQHFTTLNAQRNLSSVIKSGMEQEARLGMADLITQCRMLCLDLYWNFDEIQKLGLDHLKERFDDFEVEGFAQGTRIII